MTLGREVVVVVGQAATNRGAPVLSSSDPTRHHSKLYNIRPRKTILDIQCWKCVR